MNLAAELDIIFNEQKSCFCKISKVFNKPIDDFVIGDETVKWFDKLKYLSLHFCCHKQLSIDISVTVRKAYADANPILSHSRFVSDIVRLSLMESYVLPILTYAIETVSLTSSMVHELSVCWNNVYRRIFGMNKWESVQYFCGKLDFVRSLHLRKLLFINRICLLVSHSVMMECVNLYDLSKEFSDLKSWYDVDFMKMSSSGIRDVVCDACCWFVL